MKSFKFLVLFIVAVLIFGSAGYFAYELFIKPGRAEKREKAAALAVPSPTATPDLGIPEFQRLKGLRDSGKLAEERDGLTVWITKNPNSPLLRDARQQLGTANMLLLFQPGSTNVLSYTVVKGDSLARIAAKHQSNAELIQQANQLPNINLQIGQQLVIPSLKISLELDRSAKSLTLLNNGIYLKEYTLLSAPTAPKKQESVNSTVLDKVATSGTKRIAFGDKAYPQSERSILLVHAPAIVAPSPAVSADKAPPGQKVVQGAAPSPLPGGYVLTVEDLKEIFPLVSRNTPVVIH
jgi:LysM repeat protein